MIMTPNYSPCMIRFFWDAHSFAPMNRKTHFASLLMIFFNYYWIVDELTKYAVFNNSSRCGALYLQLTLDFFLYL